MKCQVRDSEWCEKCMNSFRWCLFFILYHVCIVPLFPRSNQCLNGRTNFRLKKDTKWQKTKDDNNNNKKKKRVEHIRNVSRYRYASCRLDWNTQNVDDRQTVVNEFVTWPLRCRTYTQKAFRIQSSINKIRVIRSVCKWIPAFAISLDPVHTPCICFSPISRCVDDVEALTHTYTLDLKWKSQTNL